MNLKDENHISTERGTDLTLPHEVEAMMKNILAYTDIKDETNLATSKWSSTKSSAEELLDLLKTGYSIGLLINVDNFKHNKKSIFSTPSHWVGLRGISLDESNEEISVNVFTWGNINKTWVMSFAVFKDGYFGYVAGK
ncbi:hypothetical protein OF897_07000 [Chryseobacterium formosus]|uniref:Uncharacterized protein n=1 Tax=Chryseobacterium formosus TaxID=1537363 RepID=A0ABT3XNG2_9FLAO|nr:hypothetical protein [Chryseobacterium formosus]